MKVAADSMLQVDFQLKSVSRTYILLTYLEHLNERKKRDILENKPHYKCIYATKNKKVIK